MKAVYTAAATMARHLLMDQTERAAAWQHLMDAVPIISSPHKALISTVVTVNILDISAVLIIQQLLEVLTTKVVVANIRFMVVALIVSTPRRDRITKDVPVTVINLVVVPMEFRSLRVHMVKVLDRNFELFFFISINYRRIFTDFRLQM